MSRFLLGVACFVVVSAPVLAADTPKAAKTRKILKLKITDDIEFDDLRLAECMNELKDYVKDADKKAILSVVYDTANGVSLNTKLTYNAKEGTTVEKVLDGVLKKLELGYIVISNDADAYDGAVQIRKSDERGFPKKKK